LTTYASILTQRLGIYEPSNIANCDQLSFDVLPLVRFQFIQCKAQDHGSSGNNNLGTISDLLILKMSVCFAITFMQLRPSL